MKQTIRNIIALGIKELFGLGRDKLLLALILYSFTFAVYIGAKSSPDSISNAAIAVVDEDRSPLSQRITDAFLPPMFAPVKSLTQFDIDEAMDHGKYTFIVVFPAGFQEKVLSGGEPEVQINVDATRMSQAFTGNGYIQQIIAREIDDFVTQHTPRAGLHTAKAVIRNRFNPNLTKSWEGAVNQLVNNITMLALILTGAALIRERERGTLEHLLVMPVTPFEIMAAKIWSMSLVVLAATAIALLLVIEKWLQVPVAGSFPLFLAGVTINLFAVTSMGIFLACFARDMPQLGILMILVLMPMQILSGGTTPQSSMPEVIQWVMQLAPTTHLVKLSKAILFRGAGWEIVWPIFLKMTLLGALFFLAAWRRFRRTVAS